MGRLAKTLGLIGDSVGTPSVATVKRLFAVSGNRCAFPKCSQTLVEPASGKVVGRICHIKAANPYGPRYDHEQSNEDRHAFANLILMCPVHHDVIDADPTAYTDERLQNMKHQYENGQSPDQSISESVAQQFITNIFNNTVPHGSIVYSVNQSGGQIAHSITNVGLQPRNLSLPAAQMLVEHLRSLPPEKYEVETVNGDSEASRLAHQIDNMLSHCQWECLTFATSIFPQHMTGVTLSYPRESKGTKLLAEFLIGAQLQPKLVLLPNLDKIHVLVGSQQ